MTFLAPKLRERVQILIPNMKPNEDEGKYDFVFGEPIGNGFEFGPFENFAPVLTVWMEFKERTFQGTGTQYVRGEQINESRTHQFICRRIAVASLGKAFTKGFNIGFDSIEDLNPLKGEYYLMVQRGSTVKGRLFRIRTVNDHEERREYLVIGAEEIEERGTGFSS